MTWEKGRAEIEDLLNKQHLDHVTGDAANGEFLLTAAKTRLTSAQTIAATDAVGAFELAYESVRQAATALLLQQGLRPRSEGGHIAVVEAVRAQFGEAFDFFNVMRRIRNTMEYARAPYDLEVREQERQQAISYTHQTIEAAERLLPSLPIWQK
jgi:uncharacterized protein (UPF0332 family)